MKKRLKISLFVFFMIATCCGFIGLGTWQLKRLAWKENLISKVEIYKNAEAEDLNSILSTARDMRNYEFKPVTVTGEFLNEFSVTLISRPSPRLPQEWGSYILTPFKIEGGPTILVNRGWVPAKYELKGLPHVEKATIKGIIRVPPLSLLPFKGEDRTWKEIDLKGIGQSLSLPLTHSFYIVNQTPSEEYPLPLVAFPPIRNNHLIYALTWYALALLVFFMTGRYLRDS